MLPGLWSHWTGKGALRSTIKFISVAVELTLGEHRMSTNFESSIIKKFKIDLNDIKYHANFASLTLGRNDIAHYVTMI